MKAPFYPPTYRRLLVIAGVLAVVGILSAAALIVSTRLQEVIGPWWLLVAPSWATMGWCSYAAIVARRLRHRAESFPDGLCPGCEHPLPYPCDDPVTCTECGLCLPRAEHRKPWARWY